MPAVLANRSAPGNTVTSGTAEQLEAEPGARRVAATPDTLQHDPQSDRANRGGRWFTTGSAAPEPDTDHAGDFRPPAGIAIRRWSSIIGPLRVRPGWLEQGHGVGASVAGPVLLVSLEGGPGAGGQSDEDVDAVRVGDLDDGRQNSTERLTCTPS